MKFRVILMVLLMVGGLVGFVRAGQVIYLYQPGIDSEIDLQTYTSTGEIVALHERGEDEKTDQGPAPAPYPTVTIWEKGFEILGHSSDRVDDGVRFRKKWHPGKKVIVHWKIRIPNASQRLPQEFARDLNVSLWVDWNGDSTWTPDEKVFSESFNIAQYFPTTEDHLEIRYVGSFRIPEGNTGEFGAFHKKKKKEEVKLWTRALLSYDDPDASPDGQSLFGDVEDYRVTMKLEKKKGRKEHGGGHD